MTHNQNKAKIQPTKEEREAQKKKNADVIQSGRSAYRMIIPLSSNPYSKQPNKDLWLKGFRIELRLDEAKRFPDRPRNPATRVPPVIEAGGGRRPPQRTVRPQHRPAPRTAPASADGKATTVISTSMIARFNRRYQTKA